MRRLMLTVWLLSGALVAGAHQNPVRDTRAVPAAATPAGTGALSGTVTSTNGTAIRYAYVVLIGTTTGIARVTSTDADGRFMFSNLPVDRFTVGASKPPYLGTVAGSKRPGRSGPSIAVADGQKVADISIQMPLGGAITGTILDEKGEPAAGAFVSLLQWRIQGLERRLVGVGNNATTDDLGRYRFHGLVPGEYVVGSTQFGRPQPARSLAAAEIDRVLAGGAPAAPLPAVPSGPRPYAAVYFPGTTRMIDAAPVAVGAGEERGNIDFRLVIVSTSRVEGSVTSADGEALSGNINVQITAVPGNVLQTGWVSSVNPEGRFVFQNIQPGSYVATVSTRTGFARAPLEVAGADVFGLQLTIKPLMTMKGRLAFDGPSSPSPTGRRVPVRALTNQDTSGFTGIGVASQTGEFAVSNVYPGRYVIGGPLALGPSADAMTWTLQSVLVDGKETVDLPVEIGDTPPKEIVVTYTDKFQELSGRLQSQSGAPVSDYSILIFPEDKTYWFQGTRRIVVARPGTDGRFVLSGKGPTTLPPGKYLLAAVTDIGRDEQFDPAFLAQVVPAAIPITLGPGEKKVQDLAIR